MERTLVLIKPDAVQRGLIGQIIARLEQRGLKLVAMKLIQMDGDLAGRHYGIHQGKPFYEGLIAFITSAPVVAMVWQGEDAVQVVRNTMGSTRPVESAPGTIRGDFGLTVGRNLVHGSDSLETAAQEVALFFEDDELVDWHRSGEGWIHE
ncbi:MAG: nucleoside-diphosphate kinase [Anaerolineae bacterium]|nr:nucleoside-diphosphate kinase [Anaerolineae bacterium]